MLHNIVKKSLVAGLACLLLAGCGKEAGRLPFSGEGTQSASIQLQAGEVAFWTNLDVGYEGPAALQYHIELLQSGSSVATVVCDPLADMGIKLGWIETQFGASHSRSGSGKMTCGATLAKAGPTTVQASLAFESRPVTFTLKKADLVLKQ